MLCCLPVIALFLLGILFTNALALDPLGWRDVGEPNYITGIEPSGAHRIFSWTHQSGSSDVSTVSEIYYGSNVPFEEVAEHYTREFGERGFIRSERTGLKSGSPAYRFDRGLRDCLFLEPYAGEWISAGDDYPSNRLQPMSSYPHGYVLWYFHHCGG